MIYKVLTKTMFKDEFHRMDRGDQFSYEGLNALYDYLEELHECGQGYELDVIALCCDWTEYKSKNEAIQELGLANYEELDDNYFILVTDSDSVLVQN